MARLIARSPAADLVPVTVGTCSLSEPAVDAITWVAPFSGNGEIAPGLAMPKPGEVTANDDTRALWFGGGQALVLGNPVWPENAALADQSDAWTVLSLAGKDARAVLARLTPLDLRDSAFPTRSTARTLVGHMTASLTRTGPDEFEIMVFRSMAATLVHELRRAMSHVATRTDL